MKKRAEKKRAKQREDFDVSSYGCVDADFDDTDRFIADVREQAIRGRF